MSSEREQLKAKIGRAVHGDFHALHGWDTPLVEKLLAIFDEFSADQLQAAKAEARKTAKAENMHDFDNIVKAFNLAVDEGFRHTSIQRLRLVINGADARAKYLDLPEHPTTPKEDKPVRQQIFDRLGYNPGPNDKCYECGHPFIWHQENDWCYAQKYSGTGHCPCYEFTPTPKEEKETE